MLTSHSISSKIVGNSHDDSGWLYSIFGNFWSGFRDSEPARIGPERLRVILNAFGNGTVDESE